MKTFACLLLATLFVTASLVYSQDPLSASSAERPGPNATKEQWIQYYDQVLGRTPASTSSPSKDTTNFPSSVEILIRLSKNVWAKDLRPIPSTVIDTGVLRHVPYNSFQAGDYEMNVYGDLQNPACVEIGVYRSLLNDKQAHDNCIQFISAVLPSQKHRDILKALNREKDSATSNGLTIEVTPPTDQDAYGGWWVSAYFEARLNASRASDKELAEISVPKDTPTQASGWSQSDMAFARPTSASTEIRIESLTIDHQQYKNAYITKRNPVEATVYHSNGVATFPIEQFSSDIQHQLGFDPIAAQTYKAAITQAQSNAANQAALTGDAIQSDSPAPPPPISSFGDSSGSGRVYVKDYQTYVGPRGGVYHYSASGRKVYQHR
jgi:hypothetical protein